MEILIGKYIDLLPILLPVIIALFSSIYDGTFDRVTKIMDLKPGIFAGKICYSCIAFDVWGLSTLLRNEAISIPSTVTKTDLIIYFIFLLFMHLMAHYLCTKKINQYNHRYLRLFLVFLSILGPFYTLFPTSLL